MLLDQKMSIFCDATYLSFQNILGWVEMGSILKEGSQGGGITWVEVHPFSKKNPDIYPMH